MMNEIDIVIPMVFPQDAEWQADYERCKGGAAGTLRHARYRSWGTEELQVRCIRKYMPWVHRIHILLARESQVQPWMRDIDHLPLTIDHLPLTIEHGPLNIVFHKDFIPAGYLPCFSSPCFEMFLGRIPGLSEQFIYANDDMFPLSPLKAEDFFVGGLPCHHFNELPAPVGPNLFERKCMFQLNMVGDPFNRHYKETFLKAEHTFAPILKSSCEEVWRRHGDEISRYLNPLKRTDRSVNHYVYMLYQQFAGLSVDRSPRQQYVGASKQLSDVRRAILDPEAGIVCINDNGSVERWEERASVVRDCIAHKLNIDH